MQKLETYMQIESANIRDIIFSVKAAWPFVVI